MDSFSLGQYLREAREAKEISLAQAESTLKIRQSILESFERGDFAIDATPIQLRGFLRNYAFFLGLDEERVLQMYDSVQENTTRQKRKPRKDKRSTQNTQKINERPVTEPSAPNTFGALQERSSGFGRRLLNAFLILIVGAVAAGVIGFVALELLNQPLDAGQVSEANVTDDDADSGNIIGQLPPTRTFTPAITPTLNRQGTLTPSSVQVYAGQPVLVTVEMRQRSWVRVIADGTEQFNSLATNDMILEYQANQQLSLEASNARALLVTYNGQVQPTYGARGQPVQIVFRPNNDISVQSAPDSGLTPLMSPTPLDTPEPIAATLIMQQTAESASTSAVTPLPPVGPTSTPSPTLEAPPTVEGQATADTSTGAAQPTAVTQQGEAAAPTATLAVNVPPETGGQLPPRITPTSATPIKAP